MPNIVGLTLVICRALRHQDYIRNFRTWKRLSDYLVCLSFTTYMFESGILTPPRKNLIQFRCRLSVTYVSFHYCVTLSLPGVVGASLRLRASCPLRGVRFIYSNHVTNIRVAPIAFANRTALMQAHNMCDHLYPCRRFGLCQ